MAISLSPLKRADPTFFHWLELSCVVTSNVIEVVNAVLPVNMFCDGDVMLTVMCFYFT